jgi:hypothetical protein
LGLVHQVRNLGALCGIPARADARTDVVDRGLLLGEIAAALIGDRVDLLALLLRRGDVAEVLQHLQRRVDRARARPVVTAHAIFEGADDVVSVARLVLEQLEDDDPQVATPEESLALPAKWAEATEEGTAAATAPSPERPVAAIALSPATWAEPKIPERRPMVSPLIVITVPERHASVLL